MQSPSHAGPLISRIGAILALSCITLLSALELPRESLIKVYVVQQPANAYRPWEDQPQRQTTGSGAIIEGDLIITNAHVVSDQVFIMVRRGDRADKVRARVKAVAHDADLALLTVDDPSFFVGSKPLPLGGLPATQAEVAVLGFPQGGDTLSVTRGVVSRIEHQAYAHSGVPLLAIQIDAPINPGNSGGPVVLDGAVIGIAMQGVKEAQSIGYIIPTPIIRHVLADLADGEYHGFPTLGVAGGSLENPSARRKAGIADGEGGVLVRHVNSHSTAAGMIAGGDVILSMDGHPIANDGTVEFRPGERTSLIYLQQLHQIGDSLRLTRLRAGVRSEVVVKLGNSYADLHPISTPLYDRAPPSCIYGGLVFVGMSRRLLEVWGENWQRTASPPLLSLLRTEEVQDLHAAPVVLTQVLAHDVNQGYQSNVMIPLCTVDGRTVGSIPELEAAIAAATGEFITFGFESKYDLVLDRTAAAAVVPPRRTR